MTFTAGDRVRFYARFYDADRKPMDPREVVITLVEGLNMRTYTMRNGITRRSLGVFYAEHMLRSPGVAEVRVQSMGGGQEAQKAMRYKVATFDDRDLKPENVFDPPRLDELAELEEREPSDEMAAMNRAFMIDEIKRSGGELDESKSDAYITKRYEAIRADRGASRDGYLKRMRGE